MGFDELVLTRLMIAPELKFPLLSSGYNEQEVTQRFVGKDLAGFLQKPYVLSTLAEKLESVLGQVGADPFLEPE